MALVDFVTLPTYSLEQCALMASPGFYIDMEALLDQCTKEGKRPVSGQSGFWKFTALETYREEVAIKPPGETILSAWSDNEIEAFDSKFDSNALPGSALTEVALDPEFLKIRKIFKVR